MTIDPKTQAQLIAGKLTKQELINLAMCLDNNSVDFNHFIQIECFKVAPEMFAVPYEPNDLDDNYDPSDDMPLDDMLGSTGCQLQAITSSDDEE